MPENENPGGIDTSELDSLREEINRLKGHNSKLLDEKKSVQAKLKEFGDIDADSVKKMMKAFDSNEEAKLLAEGKLDEVVNKRSEKVKLQLDSLKSEFDEFKLNSSKEKDVWKNKYEKTVIENTLRKELEDSKIRPEFIDYALFKSEGLFSLDENEKIESRDSEGNLRTVKRKQLDPALFVEQLKENESHLWPESKGAGATGGSGNGVSDGPNPFIKGKGYNLTEQAKLYKTDPEKAERLKAIAQSLQ
ncbi:MAG: hypothetical protein R3250_00095 [Melioribacteraceae bacterium]|nr:hypothetical protein [Melioribacteraceae bacterium]